MTAYVKFTHTRSCPRQAKRAKLKLAPPTNKTQTIRARMRAIKL